VIIHCTVSNLPSKSKKIRSYTTVNFHFLSLCTLPRLYEERDFSRRDCITHTFPSKILDAQGEKRSPTYLLYRDLKYYSAVILAVHRRCACTTGRWIRL